MELDRKQKLEHPYILNCRSNIVHKSNCHYAEKLMLTSNMKALSELKEDKHLLCSHCFKNPDEKTLEETIKLSDVRGNSFSGFIKGGVI